MKQMKIVLAMCVALAMATPALALNFDVHGDFNNRFMYSSQEDLAQESFKDQTTYYSIDGANNYTGDALTLGSRLTKDKDDSGFNAQIKYRTRLEVSDDEKKIKGVFGVEVGTLYYGDDALDLGGDANDDVFELQFAYTDIEMPFDPASRVTVGLQPANYNLLVWSDIAAGIKWSRNTGPWAYSAGWFRTDWDGRGGDNNQEGDIYAGDVTYKLDSGAVNAFAIYRDQGVDSDPFGGITVTRDEQLWLGLSGNHAWGDLSVMATGVYLTGTVKTDSATTDELDRSSYMLHTQADYKMGKNTFTLGGLYTPGDDDANDDDLDNFDHIDIGTSVLGSVVVFDTYSDDDSLADSFYAFDKGYKIIYAGVTHKLNSKTKVWGKYFWHNAAEDLIEGTVDSELGHEIVAGASYEIMKGLTAAINAGYLFAGEGLDDLSQLVNGEDADNVFRTDACLRFKF